jgi:hypothetical protein
LLRSLKLASGMKRTQRVIFSPHKVKRIVALPNQYQRYMRPIARSRSNQHARGMYTGRELDWSDKDLAKLRREGSVNQTPEQIAFRAKLWQEFVAKYQTELVKSPEKFSEYCEKFRERWIAGE